MDIHVIFSAAPHALISEIYPKLLSHRKVIKVFHGYAEDYMFSNQLSLYQDRPIDVSYRALKLSNFYARLGLEKRNIGEKFLKYTSQFSLKTDRSNDFSKRLWGNDWHNLLKNSKAVLGVEGGSGVVDFGREIYDSVLQYEARTGEDSFQKIETIFFNGLDNIYNVRSLSPRHFEYAVFKCLMLLYEGDYEGVLKPYQHYVPIKKDFSNIEEVVDIMQTPKKAEEIIERAYHEIAKNPQYHFKAYVELFDKTIEENAQNVQRGDNVNLTAPAIKISENSSETIYTLIKNFIDQRLSSKSTLYQFFQYFVKTIKNTFYLWQTTRENSKNLLLSLKWFILFFFKKNELSPLFSLLTHFREREKLLKCNIINIQHKTQYCEVKSIYPCTHNLISLNEYILFISALNPRYLFFDLSNSWHLSDEFRRSFIIKMSSSVYRFLKVMNEQK